MNLRQLGSQQVPPIGLGCMSLSHAYGRPPDAETALRLLQKAVEFGVIHFDTAALSTYAHFPSQSWARYFGITLAEMERLTESVGETLDGRVLTREELAKELARRHRSRKFDAALRESWGGFLKPAS